MLLTQIRAAKTPSPQLAYEQRILTKLGHINVQVGGNGKETMVFWPSLLMTGAVWRHQYEHYSPTHRVIVIDPPGIGKSDALERTITLEECSDSLLEILDALGVEKCVLVGVSWGALLASRFAAWHPERLLGVVAANGTALAPTVLERLKMAPLISLIGLHRRTPKWLSKVTKSAFAGDTAERSKPAFMKDFDRVLSENPRSIAFQMKSILLGRTDARELLGSIKGVPTLVVAGEEDRVFSTDAAKTFSRSIPGSALVVLPETGHLSPLESPELFNETVDKFLAGGLGAGSAGRSTG